MKRPWEIYLDMLILGGWYCSFSRRFDYDNGATVIVKSASHGNVHLEASGETIKECVENLGRQLVY
jgi:hypothetical protein